MQLGSISPVMTSLGRAGASLEIAQMSYLTKRESGVRMYMDKAASYAAEAADALRSGPESPRRGAALEHVQHAVDAIAAAQDVGTPLKFLDAYESWGSAVESIDAAVRELTQPTPA